MDGPGARLVAAAAAAIVVRDAQGRELVLRRMTALDRLRLFKAIGPHLSQNTPYLGMAMLAASVTAMDGVPVPAPATEGQLEALIARLGDCGIAAAAAGLSADGTQEMESSAQGN